MQVPDRTTRRGLIVSTGGALVAGLAGCTGDGNETTPTEDDGAPAAEAESSPDETATDEETPHEDDHSDDHDGGEHTHGDVPEGPAESVEIQMRTEDDEYHYSQSVAWIEAGGTVTFVNESGSHSATAYAPANDKPRRIPEAGTAFDTGVMDEDGATESITLEEPGVYDYYCIPHEANGMIASLIVGRPDPHDQPGLAEPSELPEDTHGKIRELNDLANRALEHGHDEGEDHHDEAAASQDDHNASEAGHDEAAASDAAGDAELHGNQTEGHGHDAATESHETDGHD